MSALVVASLTKVGEFGQGEVEKTILEISCASCFDQFDCLPEIAE